MSVGQIIIDGLLYEVPVLSISRQAPVLDKSAERNILGDLTRELIGVYKNHRISFGAIVDPDLYYALYDKLTEPVPYHTVTLPDNGGTYSYTAYFASVEDEYKKFHNEKHTWKNLTVDFISKAPWRTP